MGAAGTTRRKHHLPHRHRHPRPSGLSWDRRLPDSKRGQPTTPLNRRGRGILGSTLGHTGPRRSPTGIDGSVIATTFRFGSFTCSIGHGAPLATRCPTYHPTPENRLAPTRSLNEPVQVEADITQPHHSCSAAYLVDPCYRAEIEFKAPYAVTSASSEYFVQANRAASMLAPAAGRSSTTSSRVKRSVPNHLGCSTAPPANSRFNTSIPQQQPPNGSRRERHPCAHLPAARRTGGEASQPPAPTGPGAPASPHQALLISRSGRADP